MSKFITSFALLMLFGACAVSAAGRVSCYYSNWARYRQNGGAFTPANVPGDLCTHVVYAFIGLNWENKVGILDSWSDVDLNGFKDIVALKQSHPGLKTTVAVGGWGEGGSKYSALVANATGRATFIGSVVDFLNQYGFDGLDVDWEYPGDTERGGHPEDKANFAAFISELRQRFNQEGKGWEITLAVSVGAEKIDNGYDVPSLCRDVDGIHAMAYDLRGPWDGFADVHSPLYRRDFDVDEYAQLNTHDGIQAWVDRGCPANKMIVGIPLYAKTFMLSNVNGNTNYTLHMPSELNVGGDAGPSTAAAGTLAYYEICSDVRAGWTEKWDDVGLVPWAYSGHNWAGYENERSVQIKAEWIRQNGFQGAMVWAIDLDDFAGVCGSVFPLVSVLHSTLVR